MKIVPLNCFCTSFLTPVYMWLSHRFSMPFEAFLEAEVLVTLNISSLKKGNKTMKLLCFVFLVKVIPRLVMKSISEFQ